MAGMSVQRDNLAEAFAALRNSAQADRAVARARLDLVQAMILALIATLFGRLERLALRLPQAAPRPAHAALPPRAPVPHCTPGPRAARHRGPVPPRAYRIGRIPTWWSRHRGARAIPRHAPERRPAPAARAPPRALPLPSVTKKRPKWGATTHVH